MNRFSKSESGWRQAFPVISLSMAGLVWTTFLVSLIDAILGGREAGCWFPSVIIHLIGILLLPILALASYFLSRRLRRTLSTATAMYLVVTLLIYPQLVKRYLATHPGLPGWHWDTGSWCDYQYIEDKLRAPV